MKIEENVETAHFPRLVSNGENSGSFPLPLFKSAESWNVNVFRKMAKEQSGLINILLLLKFNFIFHYTFYTLNTEQTHLCPNIALHYLYTNSNKVNKYN